ncbi:MAG: N-acetylmannosamine-6-phosphate 2-epimerase [Beutenbergiaceae bacterium]
MGVLESLAGTLIVSCQAYPGEPMHDWRTTAQVARSVVIGGAAAVRVQGLADIRATAAAVDVPVIGLIKDGGAGVYITPTLAHARDVVQAGADIVALDGTRRPRPDGLTLAQTVAGIRELSQALVMADCGSAADARAAQDAGVDVVGSTLAGYTGERPATQGPDLELLDEMVAMVTIPVIAEGRLHKPGHVVQALQRGAHAACVGTAITHPTSITRWFNDAIVSACRGPD